MSVRDLADIFHERWLATHPFEASLYGVPGYDDRVPNDSEAGEAAWRSELDSMLAEASRLDRSSLSEADDVTLGCLLENLAQELRDLDARLIEHTVTAMPFTGPAVLLATAARTILPDERAAADYLERLRAGGGWIDQQTERLRIGAGKGRLPVAPLVQEAISGRSTCSRRTFPTASPSPSLRKAGTASRPGARSGTHSRGMS
jgi:uncharacterized protein (DUF885 family)